MLVSFRWLQELCPVDADVTEVAHRISLAGLEVEAMEEKGANLSGANLQDADLDRTDLEGAKVKKS